VTATAAEVDAFLITYKAAAKQFGITWWPTKANQKYMNDSGNTKKDVDDIIKKLESKNYNKGPEPDNSSSRPVGDVWVFEREYEGFQLYIKLKLLKDTGLPEPVVCMSFHEEERSMKTSLKPVRNITRSRR